jgi:dTDP-4-amino-4,6-dideoxygalactose transaminase
MRRLREAGVGSQVHYVPPYRHPYYVGRYAIDPAQFPAAETYYDGCLSLPLYPGLTDDDVEHVVAVVTATLAAS